MRECEVTKEWFVSLGKSKEKKEKRIWSDELDVEKRY